MAKWQKNYDTIADPIIKKYGAKEEQKTAGTISKGVQEIKKKAKISASKISQSNSATRQMGDKFIKKPSEKDFKVNAQQHWHIHLSRQRRSAGCQPAFRSIALERSCRLAACATPLARFSDTHEPILK